MICTDQAVVAGLRSVLSWAMPELTCLFSSVEDWLVLNSHLLFVSNFYLFILCIGYIFLIYH